jgi:hypothetical protein
LRKLIPIAIVGALVWYGYAKYQDASSRYSEGALAAKPVPAARATEEGVSQPFSCDGRTHCSQMSSCAEATYFLDNCPGVEMDGDGDGVACESQWCGRR